MDIQVTNPFMNVEYADFQITLVHEKYRAPGEDGKQKKGQASKKKKKVKPITNHLQEKKKIIFYNLVF